MELEFDKYCIVDGSPTTVLSAPHRRSKPVNRKSNGKLKFGNDLLSLNQNLMDITSNRYQSASCRDIRSKRPNHEFAKLGSVYQSSKEVIFSSKTDAFAGRKKIELSGESASTLFPFGIVDSLCGSDEDGSLAEPNWSSVMPTSEQRASSYCKRDSINCSFSSKSERQSSNNNKSVQDLTFPCNSSQEINPVVNLHKSLLEKLAFPHSPVRLENDVSRINSPKAIFNPAPKSFDPFVKSRSHRSPLNCSQDIGCERVSENIGLSCNRTVSMPLGKDFPDSLNPDPLSSPAHLHGILKSENRNGVPFFEFSVNLPEDVYYVAKTWKVDNALTRVYTFHTLHHKRKSSSSGWGFKGNNRECTMVGQMVISCYLCTELKGVGAYNDSMVTEYILYDIAHSRRSTSSKDNSSCSPHIAKPHLVSDCVQNELSAKKMNKGRRFSHTQPLSVAELHPEMETAAIIMQVPFEKRESLKFKCGDSKFNCGDSATDNLLPNLLDLCRLEVREGILDNSDCRKMHVVIPAGNHTLPSSGNHGPSPLLDRWRLGGGCECGGWDMACPIDIFVNPNFRIAENQPLMDDRHPVELLVQGRKDNHMPAFTMTVMENGKYIVDFHARLSCLQAFSICVAILHAAEASTSIDHEKSKQLLQSNSLRVFAEEEIKNLIDAIPEEETFKGSSIKEEVLPPSFIINPPFSPIARL